MIYDCFPFFNELDLLEIRLGELYNTVDKFVLVEATKTFQKTSKPLYFKENAKRFEQYKKKIIHIIIDDYPNFFSKFRIPRPWDISHHQKNAVSRGLKNCKPDDILLIGDLDEIPGAEKIEEYKNGPGIKVFEQRHYNYFLNCLAIKGPKEVHTVERNKVMYWKGTVMLNYRDFKNFRTTRRYHDKSAPEVTCIREGGWHFSYLGGYEKVMYKLRSLEHANEKHYYYDPEKDLEKLKRKVESGEDLFDRDFKFAWVPIDSTYPGIISSHPEKYEHLMK